METYGDKVQIVFRDFPLSFHKNAQKAHEAVWCAEDQGKFWPYHDKLFANQRALEPDNLKAYAEELGLNTDQFAACLDNGQMEKTVKANMTEGQSFGVTGTPAFFVNGRFLSGAQPYENFAKYINEELELKGIPVPK